MKFLLKIGKITGEGLPYLNMYALSDQFGWTPKEILEQPADIIAAYSIIGTGIAKEQEKKNNKNANIPNRKLRKMK